MIPQKPQPEQKDFHIDFGSAELTLKREMSFGDEQKIEVKVLEEKPKAFKLDAFHNPSISEAIARVQLWQKLIQGV